MKSPVIPGSVVVGVDGSPHSDSAIARAVEYAQNHARPLTIVHAAGNPAAVERMIDRDEARHKLRIAGRRITDQALGQVERLNSGLEVQVSMSMGDPRTTLLEAAEHASILFLGSRGRGTVATLLLGSVSVAVSTHAQCPVVVVRPSADRAGSEEPLTAIVVGVEDSDAASSAAIDFAFNLASWQDKPLEAVYAFWEGGSATYLDLLTDEQRHELVNEQARRLSEAVAGYGEKYPDVSFTQHLVQDNPSKALIRASQRASIIVVGSHQRTGAARMVLGSVSRSVVEHAHCSVAVVKTPAPVGS